MRKVVTMLSIATVIVAAADESAQAKDGCHSRRCLERVARKQCSQKNVVACIRRAAIHRRQSFRDMLRVARCESRLNPLAVGFRIHHGLFQYLWGTWRSTPYGHHWIYSAKWQALATAWMWSVGRRGEWACR
jgi:hypothetical protein